MFKVAIVGTTANLSQKQENEIHEFLKNIPLDRIIISGGAKGVDTIALKVAKGLGFHTETYMPEKNEWTYYKKRNLQIAKDCDALYCFSVRVRKTKCYHHDTPQDHEKTAGCWTLDRASKMNKICQLIVLAD